jgi:hypothetical protein
MHLYILRCLQVCNALYCALQAFSMPFTARIGHKKKMGLTVPIHIHHRNLAQLVYTEIDLF